MSSLSDRLSRLRATGSASSLAKKTKVVPKDEKPVTSNRSEILANHGWTEITPDFFERSIDYPAVMGSAFSDSLLLPEGFGPEDLLFYDLETTGLSGGTGNIAFLVGLGRQIKNRFRVTQLFLADYPGETALLDRWAQLSRGGEPQVSFNGRSFDSQVLKTRFLLNRMPPRTAPQVDLLYPARRYWASLLGSCTLQTLEREILGFHRIDDLPGSEAPDAWFSWLETGETHRLFRVFQHNDEDIRTLGRLLEKMEAWGRWNPDHQDRDRPHGLGPAPFGMVRQASFRHPEIQERWLAFGNLEGDRRCSLELARRLKMSGRFQEARDIWSRLSAQGRDYAAAVELAKDEEHRLKNPATALGFLKPLDGLPLTERHRKELVHRKARLVRKLNPQES